MFSTDDVWPLPDYGTGPTKHVHALGVISLNFNMYEAALQVFLEFYIDKATADFLFDKMSNERRVEAIHHFVSLKEKDPKIVELVEHSLSHYAKCFQNRNSLLHSKQYFAVSLPDLLSLEKRSKGAKPFMTFYLELTELRRVADEMMDGVFFVTDIWRVVDFRDREPNDRRTATFKTPSMPSPIQLPVLLRPNEDR
jgi:hypothetical protein